MATSPIAGGTVQSFETLVGRPGGLFRAAPRPTAGWEALPGTPTDSPDRPDSGTPPRSVPCPVGATVLATECPSGLACFVGPDDVCCVA
ncbi:hypothetical protein ACFP1Z_11010 [Streptomyces gamaensis]|uniref:Uncharacterized protein n=1 Tax=Streptomyces gamaensis TaxID=1763542 RepID=A0ABW0YY63_9ACTN